VTRNENGESPVSVLLRGVLIYGEGEPTDVLVGDGTILEIGVDLDPATASEVIDAGGQILLPGFVDLHTHLREPGREDTETIETGSSAAALGGYTAVFAMANTSPVADSVVITDHVWRRGQEVGLVDVHPVGAVTAGLEGKQLAEMATMAAGVGKVKMFSDDGHCVYDPLIMRRALEYSSSLGVLIAQHAEEPRLTVGAVAHEGPTAARLGLAGWPRAAEESIVARDALLARDAGARVHICHASTAGTVELEHVDRVSVCRHAVELEELLARVGGRVGRVVAEQGRNAVFDREEVVTEAVSVLGCERRTGLHDYAAGILGNAQQPHTALRALGEVHEAGGLALVALVDLILRRPVVRKGFVEGEHGTFAVLGNSTAA